LTLNGRLGLLRAVYTGGYLVRNVEQVQDYTNYARGPYVDYYQCLPAPLGPNRQAVCYSPSATWHDNARNTHQSHEIRLSTPDDWRLRAIGGLFWEDFKVFEQVDWLYKAAEMPYQPVAPPPGADVNNPNVRNQNVGFFDDIKRGYKQKAAFASVDFELVPKTLTLTLGTRWYSFNNTEVGAAVGSFGCLIPYNPTAPNPCVNHSNVTNLGPGNLPGLAAKYNAYHLDTTTSGFKSRASLSWKVTDEALVYYTWSQGFRPGGFNRGVSQVSPKSPLFGYFTPPIEYAPDTLTNNELGWKTQWLNRRVQFNGAIYKEDWKDAQVGIFDPGVTGNLTFTANGPNYRVKGLQTEIVARITNALTVQASAAWNSSEQVSTATFINAQGQVLDLKALGIVNPFGELGTPLAQSPPFQGIIRARYEFLIGEYNAFGQIDATHQAHSFASTDRLTKDLQGNSIAYDDPAFSTYDASVGVSKDAWNVQLYGQNITDVRAHLYTNARQWTRDVTINRPRTIGVRFGYTFQGGGK
jgi:outer membrane receptor protein involved in Fe transport